MKYLFDINGIYYEIELSKGETKQLEYEKGKFAKVSLKQISRQPTENSIGSAFLRVEFDNGFVWRSKDAVISRIITQQERQRWQIGKRISEIRKAQGISQTELAERSGVGRTHLIRIEQGKYNLQIDTLSALADAMNYKIDFVEK